jgi:hypothetical protein
VTPYPFRLGGSIALFIAAESGDDPSVVTSASAAIRRLNRDRSDYRDDAPSIPMTVTFQAANGAAPAGWHVFLAEAAEPQFESGDYGIDAWIKIGTETVPSGMAIIHLRKAAKA